MIFANINKLDFELICHKNHNSPELQLTSFAARRAAFHIYFNFILTVKKCFKLTEFLMNDIEICIKAKEKHKKKCCT